MHEPVNEWRERQAATLEFLAAELEKALVEAENAEHILERCGTASALTTTRAFMAALRSEISQMSCDARDLRAGPARAAVPLTTHYLRQAAP